MYKRQGLQSNVEIGKRSGFIFNTKHGRPIMPAGVNSFLKNIVNAYNKRETILAENENREPELMPHISAHILRHTGCTRLGENNVNPKVMQYVMAVSYTHLAMPNKRLTFTAGTGCNHECHRKNREQRCTLQRRLSEEK